jgi:hypothetical protein
MACGALNQNPHRQNELNIFMKPTPTELALIAAALSKNDGRKPKDNLPDAAELFADAESFLTNQTGRDRFCALVKIQKQMKFDAWLESKLPQLTKSYRRKKFHQYLVESYLPKPAIGKRLAGGLNTLANDWIEEAKKGGCSINAYPDFVDWCKARKSSNKAIGANAKHKKYLAAKIEKDANREAKEKKSRLEFHPPEMLAVIAQNEQKAGGGNLHD